MERSLRNDREPGTAKRRVPVKRTAAIEDLAALEQMSLDERDDLQSVASDSVIDTERGTGLNKKSERSQGFQQHQPPEKLNPTVSEFLEMLSIEEITGMVDEFREATPSSIEPEDEKANEAMGS